MDNEIRGDSKMQRQMKIDTTILTQKIPSDSVIKKSSRRERLFVLVGLSLTSMFIMLMLLQDIYAHQEIPNSMNSSQVQKTGNTILPY